MDLEVLVILLFFAGIALIFLELFVPSGGAIALLCVGCFAASGYCAYRAWYGSHPLYWWVYLGSVAVLIPATIIGAFQLITRTALGNRILLSAPEEEEITPYQREQEHLSSLIGQRGTTLNLMTPGGLVKVKGERLHAISDGLMIQPNTEVEIVAVRGTRVVVQPVPAITDNPPRRSVFDDTPPLPSEEIDPWMTDENA